MYDEFNGQIFIFNTGRMSVNEVTPSVMKYNVTTETKTININDIIEETQKASGLG